MPYEMNGGGPRHIVVRSNKDDGATRWYVVRMGDTGDMGSVLAEAVGESTARAIAGAMNNHAPRLRDPLLDRAAS